MGNLTRAASIAGSLLVLLTLLTPTGCSAIVGLDGISEQSCAPNCGDSAIDTDGMTDDGPLGDVTPGQDTSTSTDGTTDGGGNDGLVDDTSTPGMDVTPPQDSGDANAHDSGMTGMDSSPPRDSGTIIESGVPDVGPDSPCGPPDTVTNCGACGQACATTPSASTASAGCTGSVCLYACNTDYLDCNASVGYDPDGCECKVTNTNSSAQCCGTACPVQHTDGLVGGSNPPPNFYDCNPIGGNQSAIAQEACANFTGNSGLCSTPGPSAQCTDQNDAGTGDFVICGQVNAGSACPCWEYSGPNLSKVTVGYGVNLTSCWCPGTDPSIAHTFTFQ